MGNKWVGCVFDAEADNDDDITTDILTIGVDDEGGDYGGSDDDTIL